MKVILSRKGFDSANGYGTDSEEVVVTNKNIKSTSTSVVENNATGTKDYVVSISFDDDGTKAFADRTTKFIGDRISIVLDGEVISDHMCNVRLRKARHKLIRFLMKKQRV